MSPKQPLILVPGLVCDGAVWAHQRAGLADVADCIVADVSRPDTMHAMAAEVLVEAPEKFAIAGFSMGGYVALEVLRQAPHRVTRLALIDPPSRPVIAMPRSPIARQAVMRPRSRTCSPCCCIRPG